MIIKLTNISKYFILKYILWLLSCIKTMIIDWLPLTCLYLTYSWCFFGERLVQCLVYLANKCAFVWFTMIVSIHCIVFYLSWKLFWKAWKITFKVVGHGIGGITMWSHPNQITTQVLLFLSSHENYAHLELLYVDYNERCCLELASWIMIEILWIKQLSFMPFCIFMHDLIL